LKKTGQHKLNTKMKKKNRPEKTIADCIHWSHATKIKSHSLKKCKKVVVDSKDHNCYSLYFDLWLYIHQVNFVGLIILQKN